MFGSIVVGTDGSDTAKEAVRQASELAKTLGSRMYLVSAYEPVPEGRLREERTEVPEDLQWMVNPREDVNATLEETGKQLQEEGLEVETRIEETARPTDRPDRYGAGLVDAAAALAP